MRQQQHEQCNYPSASGYILAGKNREGRLRRRVSLRRRTRIGGRESLCGRGGAPCDVRVHLHHCLSLRHPRSGLASQNSQGLTRTCSPHHLALIHGLVDGFLRRGFLREGFHCER